MADNQNMDKPIDMSLLELFNGVALVIDDCIKEHNDKLIDKERDDGISTILKQLRKFNIPYTTENSLPSEDMLKRYIGISFVILDWNLQSVNREEGTTIPDGAKDSMYDENISFIKKMKSQCYCPIFIFTNDKPDDIANKLANAGIPFDEKSNVFIKPKNELIETDDSVIRAIVEWIENNPSMYVLKKWEIEYQNAKSRLFEGFQNFSPNWPSILWDTFHDDGENESHGLRELLSCNLYSRMKPFSFEERMIKGRSSDENDVQKNKDELQNILEAERFITELEEDDIGTGDVFLEDPESENSLWYLNIRPQCDIVRGENPDLYCIRGKCVNINNLKVSQGQFLEKICNAIVPYLYNGKTIEFQFRELEIIKWEDIKDRRIGRLLSPFITRIQQRYALYLQRQGLPRIPAPLLPQQKGRKK